MAVQQILYKYVSAEGFKRLWDSEKVRFTQLYRLNDPYENRVLEPNNHFYNNKLQEILKQKDWLARAKDTAELHSMKDHIGKFQYIIDNQFGVLSLTRNPTNLLMWSHYAQEHKGVVIGIDVSNQVFYEKGVIINPEQGNVIYSSIKPKNIKTIENTYRLPHDDDEDFSFVIETKDKTHVSFVFLYKSLDWAYEEEVRIVRDFSIEQGVIIGSDIMLFPLPKQAIKCVIFGHRFDENEAEKIVFDNQHLSNKIDFLKASIDNYEYKVNLELFNKPIPKVSKPQPIPIHRNGFRSPSAKSKSKK